MEVATRAKPTLGTFSGVFIPNFLQMMGVVFFMKMGWVLGHVGPVKMTLIISLCSSILILTSFSLSAVVSNMKVEGGGAYFLLSRLLGLEFGSSMALVLIASQMATIALCTTGFAELFRTLLPQIPLSWIQVGALLFLGSISSLSTRLAAYFQMGIFLALVGALTSIFLGSPLSSEGAVATLNPTLPFWAAFALFFPAVTGIETGMSFSGDLKNPRRSLALGSIGSVCAAFIVYLFMAHFLFTHADRASLCSDPFLPCQIARFRPLVIVGISATLLSAALSGIMGAPRILSALAKDRVVRREFASPLFSTATILLGALILTLFLDLNHLIPLLTMVLLILYGLIHFVTFFQAFLRNPSWRPDLPISPILPFFGSLGCLFLMFMVNAGAAFSVLFLLATLGWLSARRKIDGNWDDIRHSLLSFFVLKGAAKLGEIKQTPKSWRPNLLVLQDEKTEILAPFAHALDHGKGFLTFVQTEAKAPLDIPCFIHRAKEPIETIRHYGFGSLAPNTVLTTFDSPNLVKIVQEVQASEKNLILLKSGSLAQNPQQINLWWRGGNQKNFELSLALAYTLRASPSWSQTKICIKSIVSDETKEKKLRHVFEHYKKKMRFVDVLFEPILDPEERFFSDLVRFSSDADFTFLGFRGLFEGERAEEYGHYLSYLEEKTQVLKNYALVLANQPFDFLKIFNS